MKRIVSSIALFVAATFITAGVWAQDHQVKATVPFNFTVNSTTVPSGTYIISSDSTSPNIIKLSDREKNVHIMAMALTDSSDPGKASVLVFHKCGGQYFLSEIRSEGASMNLYLPTSKAEKRARTQTQEAGIPVSSDVLVALN